MHKFKIGDKVKIRDGIKVGGYYNGYDFIENMNKYKGKKLEISKVLVNNRNKIKEDNGMCTYTDDMLELVTTTTKSTKSTIKIRQVDNVTYATYKGVNRGEAIRKSSDGYDERIGILLATARALNIDDDKVKGIIDVLFDEDKEEDIEDFKIGDRVIGLGSVDYKTINGIKGTIIDLSSHSKYKYGIKFDKDIDGHSFYGKCPYGYGYFVRKQDIKLLPKDEEEIAKLQEENKELNDTINKIKSLLLSNDIIKDNIL